MNQRLHKFTHKHAQLYSVWLPPKKINLFWVKLGMSLIDQCDNWGDQFYLYSEIMVGAIRGLDLILIVPYLCMLGHGVQLEENQ